ncbi:MAG: ribbon-helix-helix protein, CopG family [Deltaproteobacteria bacterium]|nr:ribbon-helix-helix protein, CopG family [Deltaproteobacteria bacterium]
MANRTKRKILNISLPPELYKEVEKLSKEQAKAKGEFVREVIRQYVAADRRWKQIRLWGEESAQRLEIKDQGSNTGENKAHDQGGSRYQCLHLSNLVWWKT